MEEKQVVLLYFAGDNKLDLWGYGYYTDTDNDDEPIITRYVLKDGTLVIQPSMN